MCHLVALKQRCYHVGNIYYEVPKAMLNCSLQKWHLHVYLQQCFSKFTTFVN